MITRKMCTGKDELKKKPSDGDRPLVLEMSPAVARTNRRRNLVMETVPLVLEMSPATWAPSDGDSAPSPGNEPSNLGNLEHSADMSDKSGDKGKPHWLKWVGAAASAVTFFCIFVGGVIFFVLRNELFT